MVWRIWSFVAGIPLGVLAAWSATDARVPLEPDAVAVWAVVCGGLLVIVVSAIARFRDDEPARGAHLGAAASAGLVALPALGASALGLVAQPLGFAAAVVLLLAAALARGAWQRRPSGGFARQLRVGSTWLLGGSAVLLALCLGKAALRGSGPVFTDDRARAAWEADAQVPTGPLPRCAAEPAEVEVRLERGARPRLSPDGTVLWFDAAVDGARQVQRMDLASGDVTCWTCGEPGSNLRPAPGRRSVLFETDRHATWRNLANTEVHLIRAAARPGRPAPRSRRLTFAPGPDDHALFGPGAEAVVWSRQAGRGYEVVTAGIRRAHGGVMLGPALPLARGGSRWLAPVAWSPSARSLVLASGNPYRPVRLTGVDFALRSALELAADGVSAAFSADGDFMASAASRRRNALGLLPPSFGLVLAPFAARAGQDSALYRGTRLRLGESWGSGASLELGETARWGAPTGIALRPDGTGLFLAQRRGERERIVEIRLACS